MEFFSKNIEDDYISEITGQSISYVKECLRVLMNNDLDFLEENIK